MLFVVAQYYIGFSQRYDGSNSTDKANIHLFHNRLNAINFIIDTIINEINAVNSEENNEIPGQPTLFEEEKSLSETEITDLIERLNKYNVYNFRDWHMFTLDFVEIEDSPDI